jgi:hypothetical protein
VLLVPHDHATTIPDWKLRETEVGRIPGGPVLDFREERQCVTELEVKEQEVEQQVVCHESKPVTVTCPLTGQTRTEYEMCPVVRTVKVKVYQTLPVQRQVIVRVPCLKQGPDLLVKKLVLHEATVPAIARTYQVVTTPNEVAVPACPPLPPTCALPLHP